MYMTGTVDKNADHREHNQLKEEILVGILDVVSHL
jgi:hypothetical protein